MSADVAHSGTDVERTKIVVLTLCNIIVTTFHDRVVIAEAIVGSSGGADVFGADLLIVALLIGVTTDVDMAAFVAETGILGAGVFVIAVHDSEAAVLGPLVGTDGPHARADVEGAEILVHTFGGIIVATVEDRLVVAETEVGSSKSALVASADLFVIALCGIVAAVRNGLVDACVIEAIPGGAAVAILAVAGNHAATGPGCLKLAKALVTKVLGAVILIGALFVGGAAGEAWNRRKGARVVGTFVEGAGQSVIALEVGHAAVGVGRGCVLAATRFGAGVVGARVAIVATLHLVVAARLRITAVRGAGQAILAINDCVNTTAFRVTALFGAGVLVGAIE